MLGLFESIFGNGAAHGVHYPEQLVDKAIERAVDGTDSRLRLVPGYQRKLRSPTLKAIHHVISLVEDLPPPAEISRPRYGTDSELSAFFVSYNHIKEVIGSDRALSEVLRSTPGATPDQFVALLLMQKRERNVAGMALDGDILRRDVPQVTVSFSAHRLLDATAEEEHTRRLLRRRAFDHLLELALARITSARVERTGLEQRRKLLRHKLAAFRAGRWGFGQATHEPALDPGALEAQIESIEEQLRGLGAGPRLLETHLEILSEVLDQAEQNLWSTPTPLIVDRMGIRYEHPTEGARELNLNVLHSANGSNDVMRLVSIAREELPPRRDFLQEARRYLG